MKKIIRVVIKAISVIFLWSLVVYLIVFIDPQMLRDVGVEGLYLPFLVILFLALLYTGIVTLKVFRFAAAISLAILLIVILGIVRVLSIFSFLIIAVIVILLLVRAIKEKRKLK